MKTKCYSVRLKELVSISDKCFKAVDFNNNSDLIPKSQVFGDDFSVNKSEAYWISEWILSKKTITYSNKKCAWYDSETNQLKPHIQIISHTPEPINKDVSHDDSLFR